ncbi:MAG: hypothetical protein SchgKO_21120 [Schleiferiaceae bacterium]
MSIEKTILIADDEPMILKALEFKLKKEGYKVIIASDGKEVKERIDDSMPDLLITDIMMPFFNGLEVLTYAKEKSENKLPVLVLSAVGQEANVLEAFQLGADDFMTKPFSPNELGIRVKKLLTNL